MPELDLLSDEAEAGCRVLQHFLLGQRATMDEVLSGAGPVIGCNRVGCVAAIGGDCCFGLLTFVLLLANSRRIVWGKSGSNLTPCCKSCFAASALARVVKVTKPTGEDVFPFLLVTFNKEPS